MFEYQKILNKVEQWEEKLPCRSANIGVVKKIGSAHDLFHRSKVNTC